MPLSGLLLVLAAALCHATWNVCVKRINGGPELIWLFSFIATLIYLPLAVWIILVDKPEFDLIDIAFIFGSVVIHLAYFLLLQTGYRKGDLSLVYPIARATGPLLSTSFAVLFLGEAVSAQMAVAALIVIGGVLMLSGGIRAGANNAKTSLAFGLGTGVLIGSYTAWDAYSVATLMIPPLLLDYASSIGRTVMLAPVAMKNRASIARHWRDHGGLVIIVAIFNPAAYMLVLYALTFTPVAYVAPTRELSVVFTVIAGSLLLGEGHLKHRLIWAAVIVTGIALLVTG